MSAMPVSRPWPLSIPQRAGARYVMSPNGNITLQSSDGTACPSFVRRSRWRSAASLDIADRGVAILGNLIGLAHAENHAVALARIDGRSCGHFGEVGLRRPAAKERRVNHGNSRVFLSIAAYNGHETIAPPVLGVFTRKGRPGHGNSRLHQRVIMITWYADSCRNCSMAKRESPFPERIIYQHCERCALDTMFRSPDCMCWSPDGRFEDGRQALPNAAALWATKCIEHAPMLGLVDSRHRAEGITGLTATGYDGLL